MEDFAEVHSLVLRNLPRLSVLHPSQIEAGWPGLSTKILAILALYGMAPALRRAA